MQPNVNQTRTNDLSSLSHGSLRTRHRWQRPVHCDGSSLNASQTGFAEALEVQMFCHATAPVAICATAIPTSFKPLQNQTNCCLRSGVAKAPSTQSFEAAASLSGTHFTRRPRRACPLVQIGLEVQSNTFKPPGAGNQNPYPETPYQLPFQLILKILADTGTQNQRKPFTHVLPMWPRCRLVRSNSGTLQPHLQGSGQSGPSSTAGWGRFAPAEPTKHMRSQNANGSP